MASVLKQSGSTQEFFLGVTPKKLGQAPRFDVRAVPSRGIQRGNRSIEKAARAHWMYPSAVRDALTIHDLAPHQKQIVVAPSWATFHHGHTLL